MVVAFRDKGNCSRTEVNCTNLWAEIRGCESGIYCRWILIRQELLGGSCVTSGDVAEISTSPSAACLLILKLMEKDDLEFPNSGQTDPCARPGVGLDDPFGPFWLWIICDSVKADLQWGFGSIPWAHPPFVPLAATIKSTGGGRMPAWSFRHKLYLQLLCIFCYQVKCCLKFTWITSGLILCSLLYPSPFCSRKKSALSPQNRICEE